MASITSRLVKSNIISSTNVNRIIPGICTGNVFPNVHSTSGKRNLSLNTNGFLSLKNNISLTHSNCNSHHGLTANVMITNIPPISLQPWHARFFSQTTTVLDQPKKDGDAVNNPQLKIDPEKFLIGFTCKKCNNRSYKFISKKSYYEGVVIIRCDKCKNLHLIADHLGWYDSMNKFGTIEDYFKRQEKNPNGAKTVIRKDLQQLTQTEQNDVIEFLKEEQKEQTEEPKK